MNEKIALVLMGGLDMPCRMTHTFLWAVDISSRGGDVKIVLEGEAPHWLLELPDPSHGRHQAQAVEAAAEEGLRLVYDASGHVSLVPYVEDGYQIVML